jgi:hypothetical protein
MKILNIKKATIFRQTKVFIAFFLFFLFFFYLLSYLNYLRFQKLIPTKNSANYQVVEYLDVRINNIFSDSEIFSINDDPSENLKKYKFIEMLYDEIYKQVIVYNFLYKTDCNINPKPVYNLRVEIKCHDNLLASQKFVIESFRKKENSILNSEDFKYFKSSNKNLFHIEKVVKEKVTVKDLGFGNYLTNLYSNKYHSLNFIFMSLIATAIIFTILKKRL